MCVSVLISCYKNTTHKREATGKRLNGQARPSRSPELHVCVHLPAGAYVTLTAPSSSDAVGCLQELHTLQLPNNPLLFGLHPVAAIASNKAEGRRLLEEVVSMERCSTATAAILSAGAAGSAASAAEAEPATEAPHEAGGAAVRGAAAAPAAAPVAAVVAVVPLEEQMTGIIAQLLRQLPALLERSGASILHDPFAALTGGRMNPMGVVLLQEMER